MAKYEPKSLKSIAIIGHGGTGKTSLCESLIYVAGKADRLGRVDDGTSSLDYEPEEQKRRISISAAVSFLECEKQKITIIDTPGDSNFAYDTKNCLQNVDNALVVIDAVGGVEFQTEMVWEYSKEFKLPKIVFINRMDRERANFFKALESIKDRLGDKVTPIFLPIGEADTFRGIVDLLENKALFFDDPKGTGKSGDIPDDMKDLVEKYRNNMTEDIADAILDAYLAQDQESHVAAEVMCKNNLVILGGEISSRGKVSYEELVRTAIREIGYIDDKEPFSADTARSWYRSTPRLRV